MEDNTQRSDSTLEASAPSLVTTPPQTESQVESQPEPQVEPQPEPKEETEIMRKLKAHIKEKGITQAEFARKIEADKMVVNKWFTGKNKPSRVYRRLMNLMFGLDLDS